MTNVQKNRPEAGGFLLFLKSFSLDSVMLCRRRDRQRHQEGDHEDAPQQAGGGGARRPDGAALLRAHPDRALQQGRTTAPHVPPLPIGQGGNRLPASPLRVHRLETEPLILSSQQSGCELMVEVRHVV